MKLKINPVKIKEKRDSLMPKVVGQSYKIVKEKGAINLKRYQTI
jgi:hypothetical protein